MSDAALRTSPPEDVRTHRDQILELAEAHGLSDLRLTPDGRLLVRLESERTYMDLADFELAIEDAAGLTVEVVPDGVLDNAGHPHDLDAARPL
jgi:type II secretory pathway component PulL